MVEQIDPGHDAAPGRQDAADRRLNQFAGDSAGPPAARAGAAMPDAVPIDNSGTGAHGAGADEDGW